MQNIVQDENSMIAQMRAGFVPSGLITFEELSKIVNNATKKAKTEHPFLVPVYWEKNYMKVFYQKNTIRCKVFYNEIIAPLKVPMTLQDTQQEEFGILNVISVPFPVTIGDQIKLAQITLLVGQLFIGKGKRFEESLNNWDCSGQKPALLCWRDRPNTIAESECGQAVLQGNETGIYRDCQMEERKDTGSYRPIEYEQGKWLIHKHHRQRVKEICPKSLEDYHRLPNGADVAQYKTRNDSEAVLMSAKPNCIIATRQEYLHHAPYRT